MTTFATNVGTPAAAMATAAATAMADLDVLRTNFAPNFPGTTLGNLGGSHASALQSAMGNLRNDLDAAELDFRPPISAFSASAPRSPRLRL